MGNAAVGTCGYVFLALLSLPGSRIAESRSDSIFNILRSYKSQFLHILSDTLYLPGASFRGTLVDIQGPYHGFNLYPINYFSSITNAYHKQLTVIVTYFLRAEFPRAPSRCTCVLSSAAGSLTSVPPGDCVAFKHQGCNTISVY